MPYIPVETIEVQCWGKRVGVIAPDPQSRSYAFEYYPDWQERRIELSPLQAPSTISGPQYFSYLPYETFRGLPAFVADSLPDRFGNSLITAYMATQGLSRNEVTPLDRLAYMGRRAIGALEFQLMIDTGDTHPSAVEMGELVEEARRSLAGDLSDSSANPTESLKRLISVGSSAGGARSKAVIGWNPRSGHFVSGQFDIPDGYEHWLIKFSFDSETGQPGEFGKVEYAYSLMARDCGIAMSECHLQDVEGSKHFMTRRFDRIGSEKVHLQTLCAMEGLDFSQPHAHDYVQLFDAARQLDLGYDATDELFMRMVFNVCMENNDDHPKNFSFMLREGERWKLAPAYDLTFSHDSRNTWLDSHQMAVNGKFRNINRNDLLAVARRFHVSDPNERIDEVRHVAEMWAHYAEDAQVSSAEAARIGEFIRRRSGELA